MIPATGICNKDKDSFISLGNLLQTTFGSIMAQFAYIVLSCLLVFSSSLALEDYDYESEEDNEMLNKACNVSTCQPPTCSCFSIDPPKSLKVQEVPQFVMLTFDDAITVANVDSYYTIANGKRKNKGNGCPIGLTFFVCHEYNDYNITNKLYKAGHEIAVHSITHESSTETWKTSGKKRWTDEIVGMKEILSKFGGIPKSTILGHRAPFLQTAGDITFEMLKENNFLYDSSLSTRAFMNPPIWPYTLDYGYSQDCQIQPCPKKSFPGLWMIPMVQYERTSTDKLGVTTTFHCSMADACTPYPETVEDTESYLKTNFERHYLQNRSPFPLFLHEAWLKNKNRTQGYLNFVDYLLEKDDVFIVTIQEVVNYMKDPVHLEEYKLKKPCFASEKPAAIACSHPKNCNFEVRNRFMKSCVPCPKRYPWLENPYGEVKKKKKKE